MDDCAEFEDKFKNQTLTFLGVTVNAWRGQPGDFVIRGSLQETVPDAEPISMPRALKVHEHLGHMSRNRKSLLNQSQLTCLCVCVCWLLCSYLVEERKEVLDVLDCFQRLSELQGLAP